jgi:hypothetical protein
MSNPLYRNEFEQDGLKKVRDNVLRRSHENSEKQEQAKEWIEEREAIQRRTRENRLEIAAWLAAFFAFVAAFFSVTTYFR